MTAAVLLFALLAAGPRGGGEAPDATSVALTEARALVNQGQPAAALQRLKGLDPKDPRVAHLMGVAHYHADEPVQAIERLLPVVDKLPNDSIERREAAQVLGLSLYVAGRFPECIPYLEQTRRWAVNSSELLYVLGQAYIQTRQPDPAREVLAGLFRVPPDSAAAYLLTAQLMVHLEFEELADAQLRKAIEKDPRLPQARYLLAQAAIFRGRLDEAVTLLEKELEVNPDNAMAFYRLGDAYSRGDRWDEAIVALQKSIWLSPHFSGPYILLGKAYMKKEQSATAEGMLRRAIGYDPNNKSAHYLLGQLLQRTGRAAEAKQEFEIAERLQGEPGRP
jgi:tetratricopeptide (TPR) repeat protein